MAFSGLLNMAIADELGLARKQVGLWRRRWQHSFDALVAIECRETQAELRRAIGEVLSDAPRHGSTGSFTASGRQLRSRLQSVGLYRSSGHGHHNGCVVVPVWDDTGRLLELYGRKIARGAHACSSGRHVYLSPAWRDRHSRRGVFNVAVLAATEEVILCDSILNALAFWCVGLRNVTCSWGIDGFTREHLETLERCSIRRVLIAYRRTEEGDRAAEQLAARLVEKRIEAYRVLLPRGMDATRYAMRSGCPAEDLPGLVQRAECLGRSGGSGDVSASSVSSGATAQPSSPETRRSAVSADTSELSATCHGSVAPMSSDTNNCPSSLDSNQSQRATSKTPDNDDNAQADSKSDDNHDNARADSKSDDNANGRTDGSVQQTSNADGKDPDDQDNVEIHPTGLTMTFDDRRYRVRGLEKNYSLGRLKVNVSVFRDGRTHRDILDLCGARARSSFVKQAAAELYVDEDRIKQDVGHLLDRLETLQEAQIAKRLTVVEEPPVELTPREQDEACHWLRGPRLLERILEDYVRYGLVGEEINKLSCYLACVSRWLPHPLAVLIQSSSAAGKTSLMDATLAFMPPEQQIRYSAMTEQSLYYMGGRSLKHRILAIAEEEGVAQASYALKLLQSDGKLRIASPGKDAQTGRHQTQDYEVEGPVMMFLTTTCESPDPELQSRCLTLRVNERHEQTQAIHAAQRMAYTLDGQAASNERAAICQLQQNAQRLLRPMRVIIPWADQLTFRTDQTRMRRHHEKYLSLIAAVTLLHQYQRPQKRYVRNGHWLSYIESTLEDIAWAHRLANEALGHSLESLMPQTRQLLVLMDDYVGQRAGRARQPRSEVRVKQRELREAFGWSDFQLREHLNRLVELEYVLVYRTGRGNEREYELLYQGEGRDGRPFLLGLADISRLGAPKYDDVPAKYDARTEGVTSGNEPHSSPIRAPIEPESSEPKNDATFSGVKEFGHSTCK